MSKIRNLFTWSIKRRAIWWSELGSRVAGHHDYGQSLEDACGLSSGVLVAITTLSSRSHSHFDVFSYARSGDTDYMIAKCPTKGSCSTTTEERKGILHPIWNQRSKMNEKTGTGRRKLGMGVRSRVRWGDLLGVILAFWDQIGGSLDCVSCIGYVLHATHTVFAEIHGRQTKAIRSIIVLSSGASEPSSSSASQTAGVSRGES
ncbi:hypothetical protein PM082_010029 [Marasmius tenuissimus]|nr:hypothetical protein PM082_010029 [Marasmius tenuissimus]